MVIFVNEEVGERLVKMVESVMNFSKFGVISLRWLRRSVLEAEKKAVFRGFAGC